MANRPPEADRHRRGVCAELDQPVAHRVRQLGGTLRRLPILGTCRNPATLRKNRRRNDAIVPCNNRILAINAGSHFREHHGTILVFAEVLFARPHQLHRPLHRHANRDRLGNVVLLDLATQTAAHQRGVDGNLARGESRQGLRRLQHPRRSLSRSPDHAARRRPAHGAVQHFHTCMREIRKGVSRTERLRRHVHRRGDIPDRLGIHDRPVRHDGCRLRVKHRRVDVRGRGRDIPGDPSCAMPGIPGRIRYRRDSVTKRHHGNDVTSRTLGRVGQCTSERRAVTHHRIHHIRHTNVDPINRLPIRLARNIEPRHRLSDEAQLGIGNERRICRWRQQGCRWRNRRVGENAARRPMNDSPVRRRTFGNGNTPVRCRCLDQHRPNCSARLPQRQVVIVDRATAARDVRDASRDSRLHLNLGPGHHELFGQQLRQPGHGALSKLAAAEVHGNGVVCIDLNV